MVPRWGEGRPVVGQINTYWGLRLGLGFAVGEINTCGGHAGAIVGGGDAEEGALPHGPAG